MSTTLTAAKKLVAFDALEFVQRITDFDKRHDAVNHVIRDVKILGATSKNGRRYTAKAVKQAAEQYEGAAVCIDHPPVERIAQPRGFRERWGTIKNVQHSAVEARGDLHYNPDHADTPGILYALRSSMGGGLSHNFRYLGSRGDDGMETVEEVTKVRTVDLVLSPATTRDMFESEGEDPSLRDRLTLLVNDAELTDETLRASLAELLATSPAVPDAAEPTSDAGDVPADVTTPQDAGPASGAVEQITALIGELRTELTGPLTSLTQRLDAIEQHSQLEGFCASRGGSYAALTAERQTMLRDATEGERETLWDSWAPAARGAARPAIGAKVQNATEGEDPNQPTKPQPGAAPLGPRKTA